MPDNLGDSTDGVQYAREMERRVRAAVDSIPYSLLQERQLFTMRLDVGSPYFHICLACKQFMLTRPMRHESELMGRCSRTGNVVYPLVGCSAWEFNDGWVRVGLVPHPPPPANYVDLRFVIDQDGVHQVSSTHRMPDTFMPGVLEGGRDATTL